MNPVRIEGADLALGKPGDWDDDASGRCATLFVRRDNDRGVGFLRSAWETSPDEALCLLAGAKLQLGIASSTHPVVNLGIGPLPADFMPPLIVEQTLHHGVRAVRVQMLFPVGQRVYAEVSINDEGLGQAIKFAVGEIERFAREQGMLQ